jgi:hypothetical protein
VSGRRRNPKGGARSGFYVPANVPRQKLTDREWTRLSAPLGCEADELKVRNGRSLRDALDYAINATASALVEVPKLPTAREVAPPLAAQAQEILAIGEALRDAARLTRSALERLVAIRVYDGDGDVFVADEDAPVLGLQREETSNIASAAEALFQAAENARATALQTMQEAEHLAGSSRADAQRPAELHRLLVSLVSYIAEAGVDVNLPSAAEYDRCDEFPLFRAARVAIALACDRAGLRTHNALKWSASTLLAHLMATKKMS